MSNPLVIEQGCYWAHYFPWDVIGAYLEGSAGHGMYRREIAVQWGTRNSVMQRNRSYRDVSELRDAVCSGEVARLESGPFYASAGRKGFKGFQEHAYPIELRLDVDITDYANCAPSVVCADHDVRDGACDVCWCTRLEPGMRVLEYLLREVAGLEHVLRVWSGNKGYHLLCLDRKCYAWDDEVREQVLRELVTPSDPQVLDHVYEQILGPLFERQYLAEDTPYALRMEWVAYGTDFQFDGKTPLEAYRFVEQCLWGDMWHQYKRGLLALLYWPRVDAAPLQHSHLLKVPFCVHERSGKVSLPLVDAEAFRPSTAPTRTSVLEQVHVLDPAVRYMERVVRAARVARTTLECTRFPANSPYVIGVDWTGNAPDRYAYAMARAAAVFEDALVVVPDEEWRMRVRVAGHGNVLVAGSSLNGVKAAKHVLITHLEEGDSTRWFKEHSSLSNMVLVAFDSRKDGIVVTNEDDAELMAKRIRQMRLWM